MIIVHLDPKRRKRVTRDGDDVHVWVENSIDWVIARNETRTGAHEAFVAQRHVFVFEELEARQRDRLREFGELIQLDDEAYRAFFNLLAVLRRWRYFFDRAEGWDLLAKATQDAYAWYHLQRLARALRKWTRTWPPGEPTRVALAALRTLQDVMCLPNAWLKVMHPYSPIDRSLPSRWMEALKT